MSRLPPLRPPAWVADAGVAAVLLALTVTVDHDYLTENPKVDMMVGGPAEWHHLSRWWWIATAAAVLAVVARRAAPFPALVIAFAATVGHLQSPAIVPITTVDLAAPLALYTVAATARRPVVSRLVLVATVAAAVPLAVSYRPPEGSSGAGPLLPPVVLALAWFVGDATRTRRAYLASLEQRAAALVRERDQQAEIATAAERARIARELHDAVAHALAVIVLQAQAATGSLRSRPERSEQALAAITSSGRAAMVEVRRLLGMYRPDSDAHLAPLPDLGGLDDLLDRVRGAGLRVDATVTGSLADLPAGVALSAYRIVQEALTNTLKHAGPDAAARVLIDREPASLTITVADTGPAPGHPWVPGNGIRGIRERVAALGGTLHIGHDGPGGFAVRARLPVEAA